MKTLMRNVRQSCPTSLLKGKVSGNQGDIDDLKNLSQDEESIMRGGPNEEPANGRIAKYDNDSGTNSLLMQENPLDSFSEFAPDESYLARHMSSHAIAE